MNSLVYHYMLRPPTSIWYQTELTAFDELILSWNCPRPAQGALLFSISVLTQEWSPFFSYALWGWSTQKSFSFENTEVFAYQDIVRIKSGRATGFKIKIEALEGAKLTEIGLHVCCSLLAGFKRDSVRGIYFSTSTLPIPCQSQMALSHPRNQSMCSPTSTAAVVTFLTRRSISPLGFAHAVYDHGFDIYGNWALNVAQAASHLGTAWQCWVERLSGFDGLLAKLKQGLPLVVSVKGDLPGAPVPYQAGHLIAIRGYDLGREKVLCMDPAYPKDEETYVEYDLADFLPAWEARQYLAYVFDRPLHKSKSCPCPKSYLCAI